MNVSSDIELLIRPKYRSMRSLRSSGWRLLVVAPFLAVLSLPLDCGRARALTFDWQYTTVAGSTGGAGQIIMGTISGLVEGTLGPE